MSTRCWPRLRPCRTLPWAVILVRGSSSWGPPRDWRSDWCPRPAWSWPLVPRVPLPAAPSGDLLRLPHRLGKAISAATEAIETVRADVVVGFGGYVSTPAYLAARKAGVPVVIHEQNARPGLANRLGASWAQAVALTFASTRLKARSTPMARRTDTSAVPPRLTRGRGDAQTPAAHLVTNPPC